MTEVIIAGNKSDHPKPKLLDRIKLLIDLHLTRGAGVKKTADDDEESSSGSSCGIVSVVLTLIMVSFAFARRNECDAEPMIPIWIITLGSIWILTKLIEVARRRYKPKTPVPTTETMDAETGETKNVAKPNQPSGFPIPISLFYFLLKVVSVVWFGFGCYWVFSAYPNRQYCDWWVFYAALVYLIISIALSIFSCCILCCIGCILKI